MNVHRTDRMWLLGGVIMVILMVVASWFLLIHPKYAEASATRDETGNLTVQYAGLNRQVAQLKTKSKQIKTLTAKLATYQKALPSTTKQNTFLRQLQASGLADDVDISGLSASAPTQAKTEPSVWELAITMSASGTAANLSKFLDRLQNVQARAVLVTSVGLTAVKGGTYTATLALIAFVAPTSASSLTTTD